MKILRRGEMMMMALALAGGAWAQNVMQAPAAPQRKPGYVAPAALAEIVRTVTPPAAAGSVAAEADLDTVLQAQAGRTPEDVAWAKLVEKDSVWLNASVLGAGFTQENLPATAALFERINGDTRALDPLMKKPFPRARPPKTDPRVAPCVTVPVSDSYPSGSAMQALVWARVLAEIFPEHAQALEERAHRAAWGRVLGGVHFPTDLAAGRRVGEALVAELRRSAEFGAMLAAARDEARARR
jgi:acid phosphatase (class A)